MKNPSAEEPAESGEPLGESVDLESWEAQLPPVDFADRVLDRINAAPAGEARPPLQFRLASVRSQRTRALWGLAVGGTATLSLAAALLLELGGPPTDGEAIAKDRIEVALGKRGIAVLEPGASVQWKGDDVTQSRGDVFYRVERGSRFRVHTPAGDVEVKGTCFTVKVRAPENNPENKDEDTAMNKRDLRSGVIGGGLTALAFVAVYEGKVSISHASEHADLVAGQAAHMGPSGVTKSDGLAAGEKAFADTAAEADEPLLTANQRLAHQVGEYRSRLESVVAQKSDLETKLKRSEQSLAASLDGFPPPKHDFDLGPDDWKQMAKEGRMKFRTPCATSSGPWSPSPEKLNALGLSPQDGNAIKSAYARSGERLWGTIKPLCAQVVGSAEVAEKLGQDICVHVVLDDARAKVGGVDATALASKAVAEMRAGIRPLLSPNDDVSPQVKVFLAETGEGKAFENDLVQAFGPEEGHRIAYSDELCMSQSAFRSAPTKPGGNAASDALDDIGRDGPSLHARFLCHDAPAATLGNYGGRLAW